MIVRWWRMSTFPWAHIQGGMERGLRLVRLEVTRLRSCRYVGSWTGDETRLVVRG